MMNVFLKIKVLPKTLRRNSFMLAIDYTNILLDLKDSIVTKVITEPTL